MIKIGTNFEYLGDRFLDGRQGFDTLANLESWGSPVPLGFEVFVEEKDAWYIYVGTDDSTGKRIWVPRISSVLIENTDLRKYVGVTQEYVGDSLTEIQNDLNKLLDEKFPYTLSISKTSVAKSISFDYTNGGSATFGSETIVITGKKGDDNVGWDTLKITGSTTSPDPIDGKATYETPEITLSFDSKSVSTSKSTTITFSSSWKNKKTGETKTSSATLTFTLTRPRPSVSIGYINSETIPSSLAEISNGNWVNSSSADLNPNIQGRILVRLDGINKTASISVGGFVDSNWTVRSGTDNTFGPYKLYIHNNYQLISGTSVVVT